MKGGLPPNYKASPPQAPHDDRCPSGSEVFVTAVMSVLVSYARAKRTLLCALQPVGHGNDGVIVGAQMALFNAGSNSLCKTSTTLML
jgi:hypothetical protein